MSEEHHHHHHHGHRSDEAYEDVGYGGRRAEGGGDNLEYGGGYGGQLRPQGDVGYGVDSSQQGGGDYYNRPAGYEDRTSRRDDREDLKKERRGEVEGGLGAVAAGAFALHEDREGKQHPEQERRHKIEEEMAEALAAGGAGYGVYEHERRKEGMEAEEALRFEEEPKKHHGWFHKD